MRIGDAPKGTAKDQREWRVKHTPDTNLWHVIFVDFSGTYASYENGKRLVFKEERLANLAKSSLERRYG